MTIEDLLGFNTGKDPLIGTYFFRNINISPIHNMVLVVYKNKFETDVINSYSGEWLNFKINTI